MRPDVADAVLAVLPDEAETAFLRSLLRRGAEGRDAFREWSRLAGDGREWAKATPGARRLLAHLQEVARAEDHPLPSDLATTLLVAAQTEARRSRAYRRASGAAFGALDEAGVPFLVLRGAALADTAYGAHPRHCHDLDLLVRRRHRAAASEALAARGWRPEVREGGRPATVVRHPSGLPARLHRRAFGEPFDRVPARCLRSRAVRRVVAGVPVSVLAPEHGLLHVLCHAVVVRGRDRMRWACDAALLVESSPDLDWEEVERLARRRPLGEAIRPMLEFLADRLGAPVPAARSRA